MNIPANYTLLRPRPRGIRGAPRRAAGRLVGTMHPAVPRRLASRPHPMARQAEVGQEAALAKPESSSKPAAICLTGLQRSFPEIGENIREAVRHMLGGAFEVFGVKPPNETWATIRRLLPLQRIEPQVPCERALSPHLAQYYHCHQHGRSRARGCTANFVQELCDLQRCERMLQEREAETGRPFGVVLRLRADLIWETRVALPRPLAPDTLYVPWIEAGAGVNDHVAFGGRRAMAVYLNRASYLNSSNVWERRQSPLMSVWGGAYRGGAGGRGAARGARPRVTSEQFLKAVLRAEHVSARELQGWVYCLMTRKALLDQRGLFGCIARLRTLTACSSLVCSRNNVKYWCNCFNVTLPGPTPRMPCVHLLS